MSPLELVTSTSEQTGESWLSNYVCLYVSVQSDRERNTTALLNMQGPHSRVQGIESRSLARSVCLTDQYQSTSGKTVFTLTAPIIHWRATKASCIQTLHFNSLLKLTIQLSCKILNISFTSLERFE